MKPSQFWSSSIIMKPTSKKSSCWIDQCTTIRIEFKIMRVSLLINKLKIVKGFLSPSFQFWRGRGGQTCPPHQSIFLGTEVFQEIYNGDWIKEKDFRLLLSCYFPSNTDLARPLKTARWEWLVRLPRVTAWTLPRQYQGCQGIFQSNGNIWAVNVQVHFVLMQCLAWCTMHALVKLIPSKIGQYG